ncbi:MAG: DUF763 domain-containing protein [Candidatus Altarchaeaceae archaeon]
MKTGIVDLPLHYGTTPRWLFERMVNLSKEIARVIIYEFGKDELLRRLSNPFWFQGFACVIGFDWHSSGTTTVACGALKQALDSEEFGVKILGGKGSASKKVPDNIINVANNYNFSDKKISELIKASKLSAKIDNACLQDGFQLYHHVIVITEEGNWSVIQQGMNPENKLARRYHWLGENIKNFVEDAEKQEIISDIKVKPLNLIAKESSETRKCSVDIVKERNFKNLFTNLFSEQKTLYYVEKFTMPRHHEIYLENYKNLMNSEKILKNLEEAYQRQPKDYEELISIKGIGAESLRALALICDLIYNVKPSWEDPVKYSFAHGGKDGYPYKVNKKYMDKSIEILRTAVENAKINNKEKLNAIRRLYEFLPEEYR